VSRLRVPELSETERDLRRLEADLRQLEIEYNMYFAGRLARPPWETRKDVEDQVRRLDRARLQNYAERFRFTTLQNRLATFIDLWDRALRAREEGRAGPFPVRGGDPPEPQPPEVLNILHVVTFRDPARESEKLRELYDRLADARRETGERSVGFRKFEELVRRQVAELKRTGSDEVAFRVALQDGRVSFTARGLKGIIEED
jgi:hypothetical protein